MGQFIDITGQKFNYLTVIKRNGVDSSGTVKWLCKCDCGKIVTVVGSHLRSGHTKACGCRLAKGLHHISHTNLYHKYHYIKRRCYNNNDSHYKYYGGKGIKMCDEWLKDVTLFYEWSVNNGYKEHLTIDRIDPNKDYSPENCRYVDRGIQARNKLKQDIKCSSKYVGVSYWSANKGFVFSVMYENSRFTSKTFDDEDSAAKARDLYIIKKGWSNEYQLNFPHFDYTNYVAKPRDCGMFNVYKYDIFVKGYTEGDGEQVFYMNFHFDRKKVYLGKFNTKEEALKARREYILKFRPYAKFM